jgi:hypothetical protein
MQAVDLLLVQRAVLLKDLRLLKLEYKRLKPRSVEALAIGTAIATARIALSKLQQEILHKSHT